MTRDREIAASETRAVVRVPLTAGSGRRASSTASTSAALPVRRNGSRQVATSASSPAPADATAVPTATPTIRPVIAFCRRAGATVSPR